MLLEINSITPSPLTQSTIMRGTSLGRRVQTSLHSIALKINIWLKVSVLTQWGCIVLTPQSHQGISLEQWLTSSTTILKLKEPTKCGFGLTQSIQNPICLNTSRREEEVSMLSSWLEYPFPALSSNLPLPLILKFRVLPTWSRSSGITLLSQWKLPTLTL